MPTQNLFIEQIATRLSANGIIDVKVTVAFVLFCCYLLQLAVIWSFLIRRGWLTRVFHARTFLKSAIWKERAAAILLWFDRRPSRGHSRHAHSNAVKSPGRTYRLLETVGRGDLCDVQRAVSDGQSYLLKAPRLPGCDNLLMKEEFVLRQLRERSMGDAYSRYLPLPVETFRWKHRSYFAYAWRDGLMTAAEIRRQYPDGLDGRHVAWMFNRTLEVLGFAHQHGWIHGAVLPPHLLFDPQSHGLQLLGWIHAEPCNQPLQIGCRNFQNWYPPECRQREPATAATDIYQAARSMIWLAGGNPLTAAMPEHLPTEIQLFFQNCLDDSPSRRPQDAWLLHEEFNALLEEVYGPPQFCPLHLT